jgi:NAD(P)H dehydrogenase (quinone)
MRILVTGATGQLGSMVVDGLLGSAPAKELAVSVRNPEKASRLRERGVDVRQGDFEDAASLDRAFRGVERLLFISTDRDNETRLRQHQNAVAAARRAGVKFIAYTSLAKADSSPLALAAVHRETEAAIRATGIPCSFLRNNWYVENEAGSIQGAAAGAPVVTAAGTGRVGWVSRTDLAEAAAAVLAGDGHENTVYELSGPPLTYDEFARTIGEVLGREVAVQHMDAPEYRRMIAGFGLPDHIVELLADAQQAMWQGALDVESEDLERLLSRPPTPLKASIANILNRARTGA